MIKNKTALSRQGKLKMGPWTLNKSFKNFTVEHTLFDESTKS